jgi:hypothetical protein
MSDIMHDIFENLRPIRAFDQAAVFRPYLALSGGGYLVVMHFDLKA